ncbi:MAG: pseudouridine synthase [Bacillota bacterium]
MERLDRILAEAGLGTRRQVRKRIRAGRVRVDGRVVRDPTLAVDPLSVRIEVDGVLVQVRQHLYLLLHKPAGVITATRDPRHRTVLDLVPEPLRRPELHPVGRLDKDTEGLLILTTDGRLTHRLIAPRWHVERTYYARLDGPVGAEDVAAFAAGLVLEDGEPCLPAVLTPGPGPEEARVTVVEGKYHQVRRMFRVRGRQVLYLRRERMGPLTLDPGLPPGAIRELTPEEVAALYAAVELPLPPAVAAQFAREGVQLAAQGVQVPGGGGQVAGQGAQVSGGGGRDAGGVVQDARGG